MQHRRSEYPTSHIVKILVDKQQTRTKLADMEDTQVNQSTTDLPDYLRHNSMCRIWTSICR